MDLNASDGIQIGLGVVLTLTLVAVLWYAWEARKQAKAACAMAEEMREQRLAEDRPVLLIDLLGYAGSHKLPPETRAEECYPERLSFRITNWGPGVAKEIEMTAVHPRTHYWRSAPKGYLLAKESMEFEASESIYGPSGRGLSECLVQCGLGTESAGALGFVMRYKDVHDRVWLAWMNFDYDTDEDSEGDMGWWIEQDSQHVQKLDEPTGAHSWEVLFGGSLAPQDRDGSG